eukprot:TRINITY_DN31682_c0_g1_i1.p1 TRINITY_DN31682_c0_g1~~TRINITY_DN31682_c0_g1_i1.p1  ORF type:complete len:246 (-),score=39.37 TRINITY_DN31682_c0_g1_i1:3-740(-)
MVAPCHGWSKPPMTSFLGFCSLAAALSAVAEDKTGGHVANAVSLPDVGEAKDFDDETSENDRLRHMRFCALAASQMHEKWQPKAKKEPARQIYVLQEQWYLDKMANKTLTHAERLQHALFSMSFVCYQRVVLNAWQGSTPDETLFQPLEDGSVPAALVLRDRHRQLYRDADLPPSWHAAKDPSSGRVYYWNAETNETSWQHPKVPLPPGWASAVDPATGKTYYFNTQTGETTWKQPSNAHSDDEL